MSSSGSSLTSHVPEIGFVRWGSGECQLNVRWISNLNLSLTLVDVKVVESWIVHLRISRPVWLVGVAFSGEIPRGKSFKMFFIVSCWKMLMRPCPYITIYYINTRSEFKFGPCYFYIVNIIKKKSILFEFFFWWIHFRKPSAGFSSWPGLVSEVRCQRRCQSEHILWWIRRSIVSETRSTLLGAHTLPSSSKAILILLCD